MKRITSRQNALVTRFRSTARGDAPGLLLDGPHLIAEALAASVRIAHAMVTTDGLIVPEITHLVSQLERNGVDVSSVTAAVMAAVSQVSSSSAIVAIGERPASAGPRIYSGTPLVTIACDVQDPGNVGAIIRAVEAAGGTGMVAAGRSADPYGPKALRGSMGSAFRLPIAAGSAEDAIAVARVHRCRILAAVPRAGVSLFDLDMRGPVAIMIGSEGAGLPASLVEAADERLTIPMQPPVESLNAALTAALVVFEARRQRTQAARPASARAVSI